ncbi:MAG TPA: TadE/TadG family type IV pilus assembly protein [Oscillatoriaceae cyanobacterium]
MVQGERTNQDELGQALVEFALVLPALALLTFGTLEVTLLIQQQSSLNAAAFMGARELSVLGNHESTTSGSIRQFVRNDGWLQHAQVQSNARGERSTFQASLRTDGLVGLMTIFTNHSSPLHVLRASASMPLEYDAKKIKSSYGPTVKPKTFWLLDYGSDIPMLDKLGPIIRPVQAAIAKVNEVIKKVPNVSFQLPTDGEPFSMRYAVESNPHALDHKGRQDSGDAFTKQYFAADYEKTKAKAGHYKVSDLVGKQGLAGYEGYLDDFRKNQATIKTGLTTAEATDPTIKTAMTALQQAAKGLDRTGTFAQSLNTYEKGLFR